MLLGLPGRIIFTKRIRRHRSFDPILEPLPPECSLEEAEEVILVNNRYNRNCFPEFDLSVYVKACINFFL